MATDLERLTVSLEARINQFEKSMAKAAGLTDRTARRIEDRFEKTESKLASFGKNILKGFIAGLSIGVARAGFDTFERIAASIAEIGAEAKRAGLGVEQFQELSFAARQANVSVDAITDGIKEMNLRADEFVFTGKGSGQEAFQRLGYSAETLKEKLKDPSALFTEIIGKLKEFDTAAQIRIADEVFGGTGGEQFVRLIEMGADGIDQAREKARDLGIVFDQDLVTKATELDRAIRTASETIGNTLQAAIINAGWALYDFVQQFWAFEDQSTSRLSTKVGELATKRAQLEGELKGLEQDSLSRSGLSNSILAGTIDPVTQMSLKDTRAALEGIKKQEQEINDILAARNPVAPTVRETVVGGVNDLPPSGGSGTKGGASTNAFDKLSASAAEKTRAIYAQIEAMKSINPLVDDYGYALTRAQMAQDLLNAATKAGLTVDEGMQETIDALADGYASATVELAKLQEQQDQAVEAFTAMRDAAKEVASTVVDGMLSGQSAAEALQGALQNVAKRLLDMALDAAIGNLFDNLAGIGGGSSNPLGSVLTGLFGGKRAGGGPVSAGRAYLVGEKGPEVVVPRASGMVIPNGALRGGGAQQVAVTVSVDDDGKLVAIARTAGAGAAGVLINSKVPRMIQDGAPKAVAAANVRKRV